MAMSGRMMDGGVDAQGVWFDPDEGGGGRGADGVGGEVAVGA